MTSKSIVTSDTRTWISDEPAQEMADRFRKAIETEDVVFEFRSQGRFVAIPVETLESIEEIPANGAISATYPERIESS
jgi:hypothetical protein